MIRFVNQTSPPLDYTSVLNQTSSSLDYNINHKASVIEEKKKIESIFPSKCYIYTRHLVGEKNNFFWCHLNICSCVYI